MNKKRRISLQGKWLSEEEVTCQVAQGRCTQNQKKAKYKRKNRVELTFTSGGESTKLRKECKTNWRAHVGSFFRQSLVGLCLLCANLESMLTNVHVFWLSSSTTWLPVKATSFIFSLLIEPDLELVWSQIFFDVLLMILKWIKENKVHLMRILNFKLLKNKPPKNIGKSFTVQFYSNADEWRS